MATLHERLRNHPYDETCFACKVGTLQIGPAEPSWQSREEAAWTQDIPAYKRLRAQGLQPPTSVGAAALERDATTELEITRGKVYRDKTMLAAAVDMAETMFERPITEPMITPKPVEVA